MHYSTAERSSRTPQNAVASSAVTNIAFHGSIQAQGKPDAI
jgi:hypothetical protein